MRHSGALALAAALTTCLAVSAGAQGAATGGAGRTCKQAPWIVRSAEGGAVGAFLGLVGAKIRLSDWDDGSRSATATRVRNEAVAGGAIVGALLGGIAFRGGSCGAAPPAVRSVPSGGTGRGPITASEIQRASISGSAYDVIYTLRRNWLILRGTEAAADPQTELVVYVNEARLGLVGALRDIPASDIVGARYYDAAEATLRWGAGHLGGAIQVLTSPMADGR